MRILRPTVCIVIAIALAAITAPYARSEAPPLKVLFIGNSLTYFNEMPKILERIGQANGRRIETRMIAYPDYALEDHIARGDAPRAIDKGGWDYVVFQQGPCTTREYRANLIEYSKKFADDIRAHGARPAVYQVWSSEPRHSPIACESYRLAAVESNSLLLPAGNAMLAAGRRDPSIELYQPDRFHPSRAGSILVALVIYEGLTGQAPSALPRFRLEPETIDTLRAAAIEANRNLTLQAADEHIGGNAGIGRARR